MTLAQDGKNARRFPGWLAFVLAADVLILDRIHKFIQIEVFGWRGGEFVPVLPFLDYVLQWNRGVSYGLFGQFPREVIAAGTGIIIAFLAVWALRTPRFLTRLALTMVVAGAVSNFIDRVIYGAVADFFHLYLGNLSLFVFNIADAGISVGAVLLVLDMFFEMRGTRAQS